MKKEPSQRNLKYFDEKIQSFGRQMGGVFTFSDLWNLTGAKTSVRTSEIIRRFLREGLLTKIQQNFYTTSNPDLWVLGCRLRPTAYVSMDSVLSRNALIGTVPEYSVSLVYPGNPKTVKTPFGTLRFFKCKKDLFFGIQTEKNGVKVADNEKAFLDILYYYMKGNRFVIDPKVDISVWKLNQKKVKNYLTKYKNLKFRKFVEGVMRE